MIITIEKLKGNSGQGSPLYSRKGLMDNTKHMVFNKESNYVRPLKEEESDDPQKWMDDVKEYEYKLRFDKVMQHRKKREQREA